MTFWMSFIVPSPRRRHSRGVVPTAPSPRIDCSSPAMAPAASSSSSMGFCVASNHGMVDTGGLAKLARVTPYHHHHHQLIISSYPVTSSELHPCRINTGIIVFQPVACDQVPPVLLQLCYCPAFRPTAEAAFC